MICVQRQRSQHGKSKPIIHPAWDAWFEASAYTPDTARKELGLANGTFYRRIKSAPDLLTKLAMAALYEGLEPWEAGKC